MYCPKCNSENIKTSALCVPDEGYVGYCTCQDCYFSVKSNNEFHRIPEMWSSRYEAIKVAKLLASTVIISNILSIIFIPP